LRYKLKSMKCRKCGEKLRRVHRTFFERFNYMAVYECRTCDLEEVVPRRFRYHLGAHSRCPLCGTFRVSKLKIPDRIDRRHSGFLNLVERMLGRGQLFHCRWCRLQFFDRRDLSSDAIRRRPATSPAAAPATVDAAADAAAKAAGSAQ
jgi:hypothetical protein